VRFGKNSFDLLKDNHQLHVLTIAGFDNIPPIEFPWLPKIKEALVRYIQKNQLQGATYIGHSMGGTLGLWIGASHPELLGHIITVDGLPAMGALMFPNYDPANFLYDSPYNTQMLNMTDDQFKQMAGGFARGMTLNASKQPLLIDWMLKADRKTYVYGYTDLLKLDLRADLARITAPVTIIAATQPYGKETVVENITEQFENLPDYTLILAEEAAHFIMFDQPEWFNRELINILNNK
jgi:pimeloyl-ACP methyl ester carboxylesterase